MSRRWTDKDVWLLSERYHVDSMTALAQSLGRSVVAIQAKAASEHIARSKAKIAAYRAKFGVTTKVIATAGIGFLDACKSDSARRLLLGVSEKFTKERAA